MPDLLSLAISFRAALLRHDREASRQLVAAYKIAYERIKARADNLLLDIAKAREAGETITQSWLFERDRLASVLTQVEREIDKFSRRADGIITSAQSDVIEQAIENAPRLIGAALGTIPPSIQIAFNQIPRAAVESLVGFLSDGSPLADLLSQLGPAARQAVNQALLAGITSGQSIQQIAREIRGVAGMNLTRALTISRTEILRAYRASTLMGYRENRDVLKGWRWLAALGARSCAACFAMHGTEHSLDESLDSHPNCRCTSIPITRSWAELGHTEIADNPVELESGESAFARLTADQQRGILGKAGYDAYTAGQVRLSDFVGVHTDPRWGRMVYQKPFSQVIPRSSAATAN